LGVTKDAVSLVIELPHIYLFNGEEEEIGNE